MLLPWLNTLPPCFCRYIARTANGRRGLSHREIAQKAGIDHCTVVALSFRTEWSGFTIDTIDRFMAACGVNPRRTGRLQDLVTRRKLIHVDLATGARKKMYQRIERLMIEESKRRNQNV